MKIKSMRKLISLCVAVLNRNMSVVPNYKYVLCECFYPKLF